MSNRKRGFSLIEVMIAAAILALIGSAVLSTMSFSANAIIKTRMRTFASDDASTQLDRMLIMSGVATNARATDANRCSLFTAAGGPMDSTTGGTVTGACPTTVGTSLAVSGIRIAGTTLKRKVTLTSALIGTRSGFLISVEVSGPQLPTPIVISSQIRK